MTATNDYLQQGITAARAGRRGEARNLLVRAIQSDPRSEDAWLWLAGVVDDPVYARKCLQQVTQINPRNPQAQQGLAWLEKRANGKSVAPPTLPQPAAPKGAARLQAYAPISVAEQPAAPAVTPFALPPAMHETSLSAHPKPLAKDAPPADEPAPVARFTTWFAKLKPASKPAAAVDSPTQTPTEAPSANEPAPRRFFGGFFGKSARASNPVTVAAVATATVAEAKPRRKEKVLPPEDADPNRDHCPYCGELNKPEREWCRRCDQSLMIRGETREGNSIALNILGLVWKIGGILGILGAIAALILSLLTFNTIAPGRLTEFPLAIVLGIVIAILFSVAQMKIAGAMVNRARWAYWIIGILTLLQLAGSLLSATLGAAALPGMLAELEAAAPTAETRAALPMFKNMYGTILLADVGLKGLFMLLVGLSWRDFYGPVERFVSEIRGNEDRELFNIGLALKRKKMWWMAMRQWEAAVARSSRDPEYLHALALAYLQLGKIEQANETIAKALNVEPNNPVLQQSRERILRLATA